jgi:probable FeS assembly SUF system protein SufT
MQSRERVELSRDIEVIQIPDGVPAVLAQGSAVLITQELGGTFTVMTEYGAMFRIDERDADALGKEVAASASADQPEDDSPLEERVWAQLRKCYDPEIPVNIVDLGLVYDCTVEGDDSDSALVSIKMTLTAPGCGMGPVLADDVKRRVDSLPGVATSDIEIVFDPPWNPNMMTEAARLQLGMM